MKYKEKIMNNLKKLLIGATSAFIVIAIGASATNAFAAPASGKGTWGGFKNGNQGRNGNGTGTTTIPASDLSDAEAASLLFMREEEKLARDVYTKMYELWGMPVFQNISKSEQMHMDQIKRLLDRYGLTDPALAPGQFTNPALQALYNQLVAQGSASLAYAMNVGVLIEQTDIADLQACIAQTDNADIQMVYTHLMNGSYNHLTAFSGETGNTGRDSRPEWAGKGLGQ